jgi:glycosyltransferase involved in cell wall biosynthesis
MSGVHLFVPMLHRRDAVGEHTRTLRDRLLAAGVESRIYIEFPDPATEEETRPFLDYEAESAPGDVLVYQFATQSKIADWLASRKQPVIINYHGITPPEYFGSWNNAITRGQTSALQELAHLAPKVDLGIADSAFIAEELRTAGCRQTTVVPVAGVLDPPIEPSAEAAERVRIHQGGGGHRWLSVGRLAPNKAHHHTIAALFVARAGGDLGARLTLVGSPTVPSYAAALKRYAAALGLTDAVDFVSGISDDELAARYRAADVLVLLSDHEGFGVPLVEAMSHGLPIVAHDAGAVREVLDGAGLLLENKSPRSVASAVNRILADPEERERLRRAGLARFAALDLGEAANLLFEAIMSVSRPVAVPT